MECKKALKFKTGISPASGLISLSALPLPLRTQDKANEKEHIPTSNEFLGSLHSTSETGGAILSSAKIIYGNSLSSKNRFARLVMVNMLK